MKSKFLLASLVGIGIMLPVFGQEASPGLKEKPCPTDYVNTFIGTSNFGTTNPGAVCPNGMMSVSPFNVSGSDLNVFDKDSRWWSTPYSSDNCFFTGFSHVNLSGVGCPEVGLALTMPTIGPLVIEHEKYGSQYTDDVSEPGYYSNRLLKYNIKTEVTATTRSCRERYTFPKGPGNILINFGEGLTNESGAWLKKVSSTEWEGMRIAGSFCYNLQAVFPVYFAIRVSKEPLKSGFWKRQPEMTGVEAQWTHDHGQFRIYKNYGREIAGDEIGTWLKFDNAEGEQIELQMAVSFVSCANAWENLEAEQGKFSDKSFEELRQEAHDKWAKDLSKVSLEGGSERDKEIFYTALYHTLIHPNIINDINGEYPMMESEGIGKVRKDHNRYTVFSLWDTYRNVHQLMTLLYPDRQEDMIDSMIDMYKEWGWMPKWELFGRETFTMEGDPAIPVIADSWLKGIKEIDIHTAYEAFIKSAETPGKDNKMRPDNDPYIERGYIPLGWFAQDLSGDNSVSHALEYYVADNALSLLAKDLGKEEDAKKYRERSLGYKHYYSKESGTLRPINKDGSFLSPFNPEQGMNFEPVPGFHEGSAWNYTFFVPHDVYGLAKLMGGKKAFVTKLQKVFDENLYDPSNEPDIAYPYLFSWFSGEEWRTQKYVRDILNNYYGTEPAGIPGNDDTGTMSAWAVFSMMGFYPDCPGSPYYTFTMPRFDKISLELDPKYWGKDKLTISLAGKVLKDQEGTPEGYIHKIIAGGKKSSYRISHKELINAETIEITQKLQK